MLAPICPGYDAGRWVKAERHMHDGRTALLHHAVTGAREGTQHPRVLGQDVRFEGADPSVSSGARDALQQQSAKTETLETVLDGERHFGPLRVDSGRTLSRRCR